MARFLGRFFLLTNLYAAPAVTQGPQPAPQMRSLERALEGKWAITEKFEPDEWTPIGGTGYGEEIWRRGPGGFTFMEEIHDYTPTREHFGVGFSWWDSTKGLRGLWCVNTNPQGCDLQSAVETISGCTFIGMASSDLSCVVEVVTPPHVRLTLKQGATIRRIGDIELLDNGTTQTIHHVMPSQGAPYVEKTIWERQVPKCERSLPRESTTDACLHQA